MLHTVCFVKLGALCLICVIFGALGPWKAVVVFAAKFCISISFVVIFVYTAEIYPTCVRGFGLSVLVITSLTGEIISPLILIVADYWPSFPLVFCATLTIVGGALATLLPETRGTVLPETMEEAVALGRSKQRIPSEDRNEAANEILSDKMELAT